MSKSKKQHKLEQRSLAEARKVTWPKMLRLFFKSMLFAILVFVVMTVLNVVGVPAFKNMWIQIAVMVVIYVIAYPFLISEFRPRRGSEKHGRNE
jgi:preprotein translocase subunit SecE